MIDFTEIEVGNVRLIHHIISAVIQIVVNNDTDSGLYLDYYDFDDLKKAIKIHEEEIKNA